MLDIMRCIHVIDKTRFTLQELYDFEKALQRKHPKNRHIRDKIRQQLQFLAERGHITFLGDGEYRLIRNSE